MSDLKGATTYGPLYATPKISPLKQAGSWQLQDFLVIVSKERRTPTGRYFYAVEIVQMNPHGVISSQLLATPTPCYAAQQAVLEMFGSDSDEVLEFAKHYPCSDDVERQQPSEEGYEMEDNLDGTPEYKPKTPAWIRR
jgi:hypothetical protein